MHSDTEKENQNAQTKKAGQNALNLSAAPDIFTTPGGQAPANTYDDGNIPQVDLPRNVIPDEVPRKDGPGGEGEQ